MLYPFGNEYKNLINREFKVCLKIHEFYCIRTQLLGHDGSCVVFTYTSGMVLRDAMVSRKSSKSS